MGNLFTVPHILIILLIVIILFGRGKISDFMGDFAKGIKSFKKGLKDEDDEVNDETIIEGEKVTPQKPKAIAARKATTTSKPRKAAATKVSSSKKTKVSSSKKKS